ncbi:MAG: hypothetical protein DHS20C01_32270 [marine bacterium B5-7]|nr:MAG: hypothetical protein DHS20C01_32270 [marine bacterium B5-7]
MVDSLSFDIRTQPDNTTCGPTCLHSVYRYYGLEITLGELIRDVKTLKAGGTLAAFLGCDALGRGYNATIYTFDLKVFDPGWFEPSSVSLTSKLRSQLKYKHDLKLIEATEGYIEFIEKGGNIKFEDLTTGLIRRYLKRGVPILTGLSATYLYRTPREYGPNDDFDDLRGEPSGHFVVMHGYDSGSRTVHIADPIQPTAKLDESKYHASIYRVIGAVMLGILTHDANLLMIEPRRDRNPGGRRVTQ